LLAAALGRLMADESLRARMGAASLRYARDNFGIDVMLDKMHSVFARHAR